MKLRSASFFIAAILCGAASLPAQGSEVYFADAELKAAVEAALGVKNPSEDDMLRLKNLDAWDKGIVDLTGLEYARNLEHLNLHTNKFSNIAPLAGLTKLWFLRVGGNPINDISPISGLTSLTWLDLILTRVTDISVLSNLTNLSKLELSSNRLQNIGPLIDNPGLGAGDQIWLDKNPLSEEAVHNHIPILIQRGAIVYYDTEPRQENDRSEMPARRIKEYRRADVPYDAIIRDLKDDEIEGNALRVYQTVLSIGSAALPELEAALQSDDRQQRTLAAALIAEIQCQGKPLTRRAIRDPVGLNEIVLKCLGALNEIGEIGSSSHIDKDKFIGSAKNGMNDAFPADIEVEPEIIQILCDALQSDTVSDNARLARVALIRIGSPAAPYLVKALDANDYQAKILVCSILGRIGDASAAGRLVHELRNDDVGHNALAAYIALAQIGAPAIEALRAGVKSGDYQTRACSILLLSLTGKNNNSAFIRQQANDEDLTVRIAVVFALRRIQSD